MLILPCLHGERVLWLIPWVVSPVSSVCFSFALLLVFSTPETKMVTPSDSSAQIVPVGASVKRDGADEGPQYPSAFPDHPDISLSHIVSHVENHV